MGLFRGKRVQNAEITIDYKKNKVTAKYPAKNPPPTDYTLSQSTPFMIVGMVLTIITFVVTAEVAQQKVDDYNSQFQINCNENYTGSYILFTPISAIGIAFGIWLLTGYTSILYYKIKGLHKYPEHQAKTQTTKEWKTLDLSQRNQEGAIKAGKTLFISEIDVVEFEYKYYGTNKITKIETRAIETPKKGDVYRFACIITFNKNIKKGVFIYR